MELSPRSLPIDPSGDGSPTAEDALAFSNPASGRIDQPQSPFSEFLNRYRDQMAHLFGTRADAGQIHVEGGMPAYVMARMREVDPLSVYIPKAYGGRGGLVPESGGTWLLPRIVGWSKAAELLFTARTLTAADAHDLGLVSDVVAPEALHDTAMSLAGEIAANAPLAIRASKRLMRHAMSEGLEDHVQRQYLALLPLFGSKDFREGLASFLEKRPADFHGE